MASISPPHVTSGPTDSADTEMPVPDEIDGLSTDELIFRLIRESPTAIFIADPGGKIVYANSAFLHLVGYSARQISSGEIGWPNLRPEGFTVQDANALEQLKRCGRCRPYAQEVASSDGRRIPVYIAATSLTHDEGGNCVALYVTDLTNLTETETKLQELQWLLEENFPLEGAERSEIKTVVPDENLELVRAVGRDTLSEMINEFVRLLGTNATLYDLEGNLVIGAFGEEWCEQLAEKGEDLHCGIARPHSLLESRGDCYLSHWKDACGRVLSQRKPVQTECHGGIAIYAVPIRVEGDAVGVICVGVGMPPSNDMHLCTIAQRYGISLDELRKRANRYRYRPPFIQSVSRKRLEITARIFGIMVERYRTRVALQQIREGLNTKIEERTEQLRSTNERLRKEVETNRLTRKELSLRQSILEAVYDLATDPAADLSDFLGKTARYVAQTLHASGVAVSYSPESRTEIFAEFSEKGLKVTKTPDSEDLRCNLVPERGTVQRRVPNRCTGNGEEGPDAIMLGVPLCSGREGSLGAVCVFDHPNRRFEEREIHVVEIYAQYVAHELSRRMLETQLRQAQEMRVLGQLTSGVAHEVRNPLNAIQAIMEALEAETGGNADIEPFLAHIQQQVGRLSTLMEDLLQLGRCPRNLQPVRITVKDLLQKTVQSWIESASPRNRTIELVRGSDDERQVNVDIDKMNQVFINLIENALQHSPVEAPVLITVRPSEGSDIVISISDGGTGVKDEELQKVFEPFFSKRRNGTGLGLSIVKRLIESHGGKIVLHNNKAGPGLTADVYLPQAEDL